MCGPAYTYMHGHAHKHMLTLSLSLPPVLEVGKKQTKKII